MKLPTDLDQLRTECLKHNFQSSVSTYILVLQAAWQGTVTPICQPLNQPHWCRLNYPKSYGSEIHPDDTGSLSHFSHPRFFLLLHQELTFVVQSEISWQLLKCPGGINNTKKEPVCNLSNTFWAIPISLRWIEFSAELEFLQCWHAQVRCGKWDILH